MRTSFHRTSIWALRIFGGLVLLFLILPELAVVPLSFNSESLFTYPMPGYSLRWYRAFLNSDEWHRAFFNSMLIATSTAILSTALGTCAALGLSRLKWKGRSVVTGLLICPIVVPSVIAAVAIYFFYVSIGLGQSIVGLVFAHTTIASPFVVIIVSTALAGVDRNYGRAANSLGATPWHAFFSITLPLIAPGVIAGALFAFIASFDEVIIVLFLANIDQYTLTVQMWRGVRQEISPTVLSVACFMIVLQIGVMGVVEVFRRRTARRREGTA